MLKKVLITLFILFIVTSIKNTAFAENLVQNGSFESGAATPNWGYFTVYAVDNTSIANWTVIEGNLEVILNYWNAFEGNRSLDLNGGMPGTITQTIPTTAGHTYKLSFAMSANPNTSCGVPEKTMAVIIGDTTRSFSAIAGDFLDPVTVAWKTESFNFEATGSSAQLTFKSTVGDCAGPALDNVVMEDITVIPTVTPAPEVTPSPEVTPTPTVSPLPVVKTECKNDGWQTFEVFNNQGDCVSFVETGGSNLPSGQ